MSGANGRPNAQEAGTRVYRSSRYFGLRETTSLPEPPQILPQRELVRFRVCLFLLDCGFAPIAAARGGPRAEEGFGAGRRALAETALCGTSRHERGRNALNRNVLCMTPVAKTLRNSRSPLGLQLNDGRRGPPAPEDRLSRRPLLDQLDDDLDRFGHFVQAGPFER
jgi:hypothetical protein